VSVCISNLPAQVVEKWALSCGPDGHFRHKRRRLEQYPANLRDWRPARNNKVASGARCGSDRSGPMLAGLAGEPSPGRNHREQLTIPGCFVRPRFRHGFDPCRSDPIPHVRPPEGRIVRSADIQVNAANNRFLPEAHDVEYAVSLASPCAAVCEPAYAREPGFPIGIALRAGAWGNQLTAVDLAVSSA